MLVVSTVDSGGTRQVELGIWVEGVHKLAKCLTTSKCNDGWKNVLTDALVDCLRLDVLRERSGFVLCVAGGVDNLLESAGEFHARGYCIARGIARPVVPESRGSIHQRGSRQTRIEVLAQ